MARYAVAADLLPRIPQFLRTQLLDDSGVGVETAGLAESVLEEACARVDGYLQAGGWRVPITTTVPPMVKSLTLDLAWYLIHDRLDATSDKVWRAYEVTIKQLEQVSRRELSPGLDSPLPVERPEITATISLTSATRVFGRTNLSGL